MKRAPFSPLVGYRACTRSLPCTRPDICRVPVHYVNVVVYTVQTLGRVIGSEKQTGQGGMLITMGCGWWWGGGVGCVSGPSVSVSLRRGFQGFYKQEGELRAPMELTPRMVDTIHLDGGSILGSSRGGQGGRSSPI